MSTYWYWLWSFGSSSEKVPAQISAHSDAATTTIDSVSISTIVNDSQQKVELAARTTIANPSSPDTILKPMTNDEIVDELHDSKKSTTEELTMDPSLNQHRNGCMCLSCPCSSITVPVAAADDDERVADPTELVLKHGVGDRLDSLALASLDVTIAKPTADDDKCAANEQKGVHYVDDGPSSDDSGDDLDCDEIQTIVTQADCTRAQAIWALRKEKNIVDAIVLLTP